MTEEDRTQSLRLARERAAKVCMIRVTKHAHDMLKKLQIQLQEEVLLHPEKYSVWARHRLTLSDTIYLLCDSHVS
jgi:hypothetical protein